MAPKLTIPIARFVLMEKGDGSLVTLIESLGHIHDVLWCVVRFGGVLGQHREASKA